MKVASKSAYTAATISIAIQILKCGIGRYDRYGSVENDDGSVSAKIRKYIAVGARVLVEGIYHRNGMSSRVDIRTVYLLYSQDGKKISEFKGPYMFEEPLWWVNMITAQGNTWYNNFFADGVIDFTKYRTDLNELYQPKGPNQECAVMSRLLYGYAVTYQLTGKQKYLDALKSGVEYQHSKGNLSYMLFSKYGILLKCTQPYCHDNRIFQIYTPVVSFDLKF